MQTILGSSGIIGIEVAKELHRSYTKDIRLVSREPKKVNPTDQLLKADLIKPDQVMELHLTKRGYSFPGRCC